MGTSRNTRKVYRDLPGDLPGLIIYRVFQEIGPWVAQKMDNAIYWINHYPVDSMVCFVNNYPYS